VVRAAHGPAGDPPVDHLDPAGLEGIFSPGRADQMISRAAALRTVRDHGGVLEETRTVEEGIRLRAILPIGPAPVQAVADASEKRGAGMILVVDDESYILSALCQMIEALGHRALPAHGGQEALDLHAQHGAAIRLVLLDLNMPIVDGEAVYRELKRRDPGLRIVLCTGSTAPSTEQERQYGDMAGILRKPFRYEYLRSVVEAVLV
jgi:two-component system cell cycle sensor histidine kinase/response regulator CckA